MYLSDHALTTPKESSMDYNKTKEIQGFLRLKQIIELYKVGESTIWARVASGDFPQPVKIGPRTTAWYVDEILVHIESFRKTGAAVSSTSLKSHPDFTVEKPPEHLKVSGVEGIWVYKRNPVIHNIDESLPPLEDQIQLYK